MNWRLVALLVGVSIPGIAWIVPRSLRNVLEAMEDRAGEDRSLPSFRVMVLASSAQTLVLVAVAAAVGAYAAPRVGFGAPFFEAVTRLENPWPALRPQLFPALVVSVAGSVAFQAAYYGFFRPRLDAETVDVMEGLRGDLGIPGRVLYGGIVEEVLTRWGLMSLVAWVGLAIVGSATPTVVWAAILVSGVLFGLGHLPSYLAAGCRRTPLFVAATVSLNLWAALIFGWLFWRYGLAAAMASHALFHLFWLPMDRRYVGT